MKTRLAILLALLLCLTASFSASAKVVTNPESVQVVFEDKTYTVSVDELRTDENGNTTVVLDGVGNSLMIREGGYIIHILVSIKSKGKEYECQSASFQDGKVTYYFDKVLEPDAILVYSYDNPGLRKEFSLGSGTDASSKTLPASDDFTYTIENGSATITAYKGSGEHLDIPSGLDGYPVKAIGTEAFAKCQSLLSVVIPEGVETIGIGAFQACSSMTGITIPASVKSIGGQAFEFCTSLSEILVAEGSSCYMSEKGVLFDKSRTLLHTYPAGKAGTSYKIPKGVTTIGAGAFSFCKTLAKITIPDSVTAIGERAFYNSQKIKSITIPKNVTSIGDCTFAGCVSLSAISVAKGNTAYASVKGVLYDKEGRSLLAYPMGIGKAGASFVIPDGVERIGAGAFEGSDKLASVRLPNSVKSIGDYAFFECDALAAVTIPEGVQSVGDYAFSYCDTLKTLILPESVASIDANVIGESKECRLIVTENSYAHLFAKENGLPFDASIWDSIGIATGGHHTVGLKSDGTVTAVGFNNDGQCGVSGWTDIQAVAAGGLFTVGLKKDGTVVAAGSNGSGECDVSGWKDIAAVAAGGLHTVGLKKDGTVVAAGDNGKGQCDVSGWTDIVAVAAGCQVFGAKEDYTFIQPGDARGWKKLAIVFTVDSHTVGLKKDGTVVAAGYNDEGQCDVSGWTDIQAVAAGGVHTVGLKKDGTVVAAGNNDNGQCDVSGWTDIVKVAASWSHTVGLKKDGTVVAAGSNAAGECDVSGWTDIAQVAAGSYYTVGLKKDGTVMATGDISLGQCDVSSWKLY